MRWQERHYCYTFAYIHSTSYSDLPGLCDICSNQGGWAQTYALALYVDRDDNDDEGNSGDEMMSDRATEKERKIKKDMVYVFADCSCMGREKG